MIIKSIDGMIPFINRSISINFERKKNIIIIGDNGAGKTSLLNDIDKYFQSIFSNKTGNMIESIDKEIENYNNWMAEAKIQGDNVKYYRYKSNLDILREQRKDYEFFVDVKIDDIDKMIEESYFKRFVYFYFKSSRQMDISESTSTRPLSEIKEQWLSTDYVSIISSNINFDLESYIVSLYTQEALQIKNKNKAKADKLSEWIIYLEGIMTSLMECDIKFDFDYEKYKLFLVRDGVNRSSFRELSSGYSSVLDIFTELLFRCSIYSVLPSDMKGIILIDEIDAHLHLSIQRKAIPVLMSTFPNIQFIITTHSPFVLGSSDKFLIFDISKNQEIPELTMFSYENIVKNVMGVDIIPMELKEKIKEIKELIASGKFEKDKLNDLLIDIELSINSLDSESKAIYYTALNLSMGC